MISASSTYGAPIPASSVTVAFTGTAGTTTAMPSGTKCVRVVSTSDCFIEVGPNPTAVANTGMYLVAYIPEYIVATDASKVSAVQVSTGGSIYVTPF